MSFQTARESEAAFELLMAQLSWRPVRTPLEVDRGIDYRVEVPGAVGIGSEGGEFLVQLKGTRRTMTKRQTTIRVRADTARYWRTKLLPVLLCVNHRPTNNFFCLWFDGHVPETAKTVGFSLGVENAFSPHAVASDVADYYSTFRTILASPHGRLAYASLLAHLNMCLRICWQAEPDLRQWVEARGHGAHDESPDDAVVAWFRVFGLALIFDTTTALSKPRPSEPTTAVETRIHEAAAVLADATKRWWIGGGGVDRWSVGIWEPRLFLETLPFMMNQWFELAQFIAVHLAEAAKRGSS